MNGNLRFEDKLVVITGASSGIGRASALAFAREGATTVLASRSEEKLERVADEIRSFNPRVLVIPTDVSVREQVQHLVDRTVREFGRIWHVGRISHPSLQPGDALPVAPSAIKPAGEAYTYEGGYGRCPKSSGRRSSYRTTGNEQGPSPHFDLLNDGGTSHETTLFSQS
jgi:short subunit dehydrogenase